MADDTCGMEAMTEFNVLVANMEFVLHGLAAYNEIGQSVVGSDVTFGDLIGNLFEPDNEED